MSKLCILAEDGDDGFEVIATGFSELNGRNLHQPPVSDSESSSICDALTAFSDPAPVPTAHKSFISLRPNSFFSPRGENRLPYRASV